MTDRFFLCRLIPPRPNFASTMSEDERTMMGEHGAYWREQMKRGIVLVFGPVADPAGDWGMGVVKCPDEATLARFQDGDPAILSGRGFRYETLPMLAAITPG
jgi:hypothetical protein